MARFAAGGFRTVSHQTYQDRFANCLACPHYDLGLCSPAAAGWMPRWDCRTKPARGGSGERRSRRS